MTADRTRGSRPVPQPTPAKRVTIVDVANHAGVSVGTVSRVINGHRTVGPELRARVDSAAGALSYVPDSIAQSMRKQATHAVGCMVSDISNPLFSAIVSAAEEVLYRNGYSMVLCNSRERPETEREILSLFHRRRFDGMIMTLSDEEEPGLLRQLSESVIPTVLLERECSLPIEAVSVDHAGGTRQAIQHLLRLGHRRIGLITVSRSALPGRQRGQAYAAAYQAAGVPVDPGLMSFDAFLPDAGYQAAYRMLVDSDPPTAIVAGANQMPQVLKVVRMLRLVVPRDLSIVTLGDTDLAGLFDPALTAVRWDLGRLGATAASLLLSRLRGTATNRPPQRIVMPTELVLRESCAGR